MFGFAGLRRGVGQRDRRVELLACLVTAAVALGCSGGAQHRQADASTSKDGPAASDGSVGDHPSDMGVTGLENGKTCETSSDCISNHCVENICCDKPCTDACYTCGRADHIGSCQPAELGSDPGDRCSKEDVSTCGKTGVCDGIGACQLYPSGALCQDSGCTGSTLTTAGACNGKGLCETPAPQSCAPFQCGANGQCRSNCTADADCTSGNKCTMNSCGKLPPGATCTADADCGTGVCAQGVCCSSACTGTCKSCALPGSAGTCTNVPAMQDPLGHCADSGADSCGTDGYCDGAGACHRYAGGTPCGASTCAAGTQASPGMCDGAGVCAPGTTKSCEPYVCGTGGTCLAKCATTADCAANYTCTGTICDKKSNGAACGAGSECKSTHCEQGVCCDVACAGTCMACNLAGTVGTCSAIAVGKPPVAASQCPMAAAASCGNDGTCNGAGGCRQYVSGTMCAAPSCSGTTLTQARFCDGNGLCRNAITATCEPFKCGTGACRTTCASSADCATPNTCDATGSCGKLPVGGTCAMGAECASNSCVQGVCCDTPCATACMSCTIPGNVGTCSPIAAGQPPLIASQCPASAASTCMNDGTCDGSGDCRKHVAGTVCGAATCTASTYTAARQCNGMGTCAVATSSSCGAYQCDAATQSCKMACTADADCVAPNICNGGMCTKHPLGDACTAGTECNSGFCQQGVCCANSCTGTCKSCALPSSKGTCSNVPAGAAPVVAAQCPATDASTCGTNGLCDGAGACQLHANGTTCVGGSCIGSTLTPARTCDGAGVCKSVTTSLCDPYGCDVANKSCKATCTATTDCASPNVCVTATGSCGNKPNGAACTTAGECNSQICAQGTCCATACSGTCRTCANAAGTCTNAMAGTDPLNQCAMDAASTCGLDGSCDGSGACRKYAVGTQCGGATCTANMVTGASTCTAGATCVAPAAVSCSPYACGTTGCKTTCTTNADCFSANFACTGGACTPAVNLQVQLAMGTTGTTAQISPHFKIINNSTAGMAAVPLSELTVRYWYTIDAGSTTQAANCDYATRACAQLNYGATSFVTVNPAKTNADRYFEFGFKTGAGSLAAGGNASTDTSPSTTGEIQLRINKSDFSNYTQTNDYSYNGVTGYTATTKVTVYRNGTLIYGTEPPAP
jgi:Cellulose binding domain